MLVHTITRGFEGRLHAGTQAAVAAVALDGAGVDGAGRASRDGARKMSAPCSIWQAMGNNNNGGGSGGLILLILIGGCCCLSVVCSGGVLALYNANPDFKATVDGLFSAPADDGTAATTTTATTGAAGQWETTKAELESQCQDAGLYKVREYKDNKWVCPGDASNDTGITWDNSAPGYFASNDKDFNAKQCTAKQECVRYVKDYAAAFPFAA